MVVDPARDDVDAWVDLKRLPFPEGAFDVVFASHVPEHIADDGLALAEIRRVLVPGGYAVLPVPIVCERTIEYAEPNPNETEHVRAPGPDYFEPYRAHFDRVRVFDSRSFSERFRPYVYEDRSRYPTAQSPQRTPMAGKRHSDFVPVCFV